FRQGKIAEWNAKKMLKPGDRVRTTKCPGTKRWFTFDHWDGHWMVSKSGIDDYPPRSVDRVNDAHVDLTQPPDEASAEAAKYQRRFEAWMNQTGDQRKPTSPPIESDEIPF